MYNKNLSFMTVILFWMFGMLVLSGCVSLQEKEAVFNSNILPAIMKNHKTQSAIALLSDKERDDIVPVIEQVTRDYFCSQLSSSELNELADFYADERFIRLQKSIESNEIRIRDVTVALEAVNEYPVLKKISAIEFSAGFKKKLDDSLNDKLN